MVRWRNSNWFRSVSDRSFPLGLIALQNNRESIDAHDNESCYVNATLPDFEPNFPPPEDFNGFGEGDTNMSHLLLCDYLISFFSVLSHNVCICWICKLPNLPGVFHQPFSTQFHPFPHIFIHIPHIPNPPGVFHQPLSRELLTDLTLMFLCSQIWRTEGCFPGPSLWPFVVRLHIQSLHFILTTFQPSWSSMCQWQLLATLSSGRGQGLRNCCGNVWKCGNLFIKDPGRQDGGIVCALCDGGVKLMVEVIFTNRDNLQEKYPILQILLLVHLISAYPMFLNPPNQFLEKMIGLPPSEFENPWSWQTMQCRYHQSSRSRGRSSAPW